MKFCFFGNITKAIKGLTPGGAELQISLLARALALKGHSVIIIDPYSNEDFITAEGIKVITVRNWNNGIRGFRLFSSRIPGLWKLLIEQKADFYYVRMRSYYHLINYFACRKVGGKFIQAIAHDLDVSNYWQKFKHESKKRFNLFRFLTIALPNDITLHFLLKNADYVLLQHSGQNIGFSGDKPKVKIFPNLINTRSITVVKESSKSDYIHVGSLSVLKGSENLYKLIQIIDKSYRIIIVGQPTDKISVKIIQKLRQFDNVILKGRLDHNETIRLIAKSKALISTSNSEGFPNIFLEAWSAGVPVISLNINPGEIFNKYQLGYYCSSNIQEMKECMESDRIESIKKENLFSYVNQFHSFQTGGDRFLSLLNNNYNS